MLELFSCCKSLKSLYVPSTQNGMRDAMRFSGFGGFMGSVAVPKLMPSVETRLHAAKTVLVVEDEAFVCEVTCDILRQSGYSVLRAQDAATAKKLFSLYSEKIDLLLCDAVLPDEDGVSLAHTLRRQSPSLKLIFASGYPRSELEAEFDREQADFLTKPYSSTTLIARVRKLLK
jgi:CheY-like chemotaxis protein